MNVAEIERIMVLGAGGRVGSALCKAINPEQLIPRTRETLDIRDAAAIRQHLEAVRPTVVINAASADPRKNDVRDMYEINVCGSRNVLAACGDLGVPLIHLSNGDIFGGFYEQRAYFEDDPCFCVAPTLASRACAEHAMLLQKQAKTAAYWRSGFRFWLVRSSLLFSSPHKFTGGYVHDLMQRLEAKRIDIHESNETVRSPTYIPWLARELLWLAENRAKVMEGVYHICSTGQASLYNIANYVSTRIRHSGARIVPCSHEEYARREGFSPHSFAKHAPLNNDKWSAVRGGSLPTWQTQLDMLLRAGTE